MLDDWQINSIDLVEAILLLLNQFEKVFRVTVRSKIEKTYRFRELSDRLSPDFILKTGTNAISYGFNKAGSSGETTLPDTVFKPITS